MVVIVGFVVFNYDGIPFITDTQFYAMIQFGFPPLVGGAEVMTVTPKRLDLATHIGVKLL